MKTQFPRRSTYSIAVYFALITSVCAPFAFFAGKDQGAFSARAASPDPSQSGTDEKPDYKSLVTVLRGGSDCVLGESAPARLGSWEVFCAPNTGGAGKRMAAAAAGGAKGERAARPRNTGGGALQSAVLRAVSKGDGGATTGSAGDPFSLAMTPSAQSGGNGEGSGGFALSSGLPGVFVPGGGFISSGGGGGTPGTPGTPSGPNDPTSPPPVFNPETPHNPGDLGEPLVTPVPPALPLMVAGLAGLGAASRRRAKAKAGPTPVKS